MARNDQMRFVREKMSGFRGGSNLKKMFPNFKVGPWTGMRSAFPVREPEFLSD